MNDPVKILDEFYFGHYFRTRSLTAEASYPRITMCAFG